ncbi:MAG: MCP four helix bundle domain-containing protein, partial [Iodobacter sp.]
MNFLNNFSIASRLITGFLLCALLTLILGILGYQSAASMQDLSRDMHDNQLVPVMDIANANMQAIYHHRMLFAHALEPDEGKMTKMREVMAGHEAKMKELLNKYRATDLTQPEKD